MGQPFTEQFSGITPHDLGLKAAYWTGTDEDAITYRPIIGWITSTGRPTDAAPNAQLSNQFFAVVLGLAWFPILAQNLQHYGGVFPKDIDDEVAKEAIARWRRAPPGGDVQVNVRTVGQA